MKPATSALTKEIQTSHLCEVTFLKLIWNKHKCHFPCVVPLMFDLLLVVLSSVEFSTLDVQTAIALQTREHVYKCSFSFCFCEKFGQQNLIQKQTLVYNCNTKIGGVLFCINAIQHTSNLLSDFIPPLSISTCEAKSRIRNIPRVSVCHDIMSLLESADGRLYNKNDWWFRKTKWCRVAHGECGND